MMYVHKTVRVFLVFVFGLTYNGGFGEDTKCVCSDKNEIFITTMNEKYSANDKSKLTKMENQIMECSTYMKGNPEENHKSALYNRYTRTYPRSCTEALANSRRSGIYSIQDDLYGPQPYKVLCEEDLHDGGWTVVLRRKDGSIDFFRNLTDYKYGFGNLESEFFIGLNKLYSLTNGAYAQELIFVLEDFDNVQKYAKYSPFAIGNESERYVLNVMGNYSGDAGDSFRTHAGQPFKTRDVEDPAHNCAKKFTGAWWYNACHSSNLCGKYLSGTYGNEKFAQGVVWKSFRGHLYSLKLALMMIRPQRK